MRSWLSRSLVIIGTFALVWLAVAYYWRSSNRMPSSSELALYFIGMPVGALIGIWLISKLIMFAMAKTTVNLSPTSDVISVGTDSAQDNRTNSEKNLSIAIIASAIRSSCGNSAEELAETLKSSKKAFKLDPELNNSEGYPILSGRIASIDVFNQITAFNEWSSTHQRSNKEWTEEQLRAIIIGSEVVIELAQESTKHTLLAKYLAAAEGKRDAVALPTMQLNALLPENWSTEQSNKVTEWFSHLVTLQGWPVEKLSLRSERQSSPTKVLATIDRLMLDSFQQSHSCFSLIVACESHIGSNTVESWESAGKLVDQQGNNLFIPGEAAAALLLGDDQQAQLLDPEISAKISRVLQNVLKKSADNAGLKPDDTTIEITQQALTISGFTAEQITLLASDTDLRPSRMMELMDFGAKALPHLEPSTQYMKIAASCGTIGPTAGLLSLVLGHYEVINNSGIAVCISNNDSHKRAVALVSSLKNPMVNNAA